MTTQQERAELRKLAESSMNESQTKGWYSQADLEKNYEFFVADAEYIGAVSPIVLVTLLDDIDRLTAALAQQSALVEKCMVEMNANADRGEKAEAERDSYKADAETLRYAVTIGENQVMNWLDVYDDWDGEGLFINALAAAMKGQP